LKIADQQTVTYILFIIIRRLYPIYVWKGEKKGEINQLIKRNKISQFSDNTENINTSTKSHAKQKQKTKQNQEILIKTDKNKVILLLLLTITITIKWLVKENYIVDK